MAATKKELIDWLSSIDDNDVIAIDDGGIALVVLSSAKFPEATEVHEFAVYFEIGGVPQ